MSKLIEAVLTESVTFRVGGTIPAGRKVGLLKSHIEGKFMIVRKESASGKMLITTRRIPVITRNQFQTV